MIQEYNQISALKEGWNSIYQNNLEMSAYQSYNWNSNLYCRYRKLRADKKSYTFVFVAYYSDSGELRAIAPLTIPKKRSEPIMIAGGYTKAGLLNFVYVNDIKDQEFVEILNYLNRKYPNQKMAFREIPRETAFGSFLFMNNGFSTIFSRGSVRCNVPHTKEQLDHALSKSVRQSIRTSYNKMNRNEAQSRLEVYFGYRFGTKEKQLLNELHKKRKQNWGMIIENENENKLLQFKQFLRDIYADPFYMYSKNEDFVYVKYIINGEIAAYFIGLKNGQKYCVVPTLIYNTGFKEYNPGLLMIYEFLCKEIKERDIEVFDLSRGVDEYKLRYLPEPEVYEQDLYESKSVECFFAN